MKYVNVIGAGLAGSVSGSVFARFAIVGSFNQ